MSSQVALVRSPLHASHLALGARMIPFAGWEMPVQYRGVIDEHVAVRSAAGLFDVCHMGNILIEGDAALDTVQRLVTNDVGRLDVGEGLYTPVCNPHGGVLDDVTVFRVADARYLMVVNAATTAKDVAWIDEHRGAAAIRDISREMGLLALQGPRSEAVLSRLAGDRVRTLRRYHLLADVAVAGRRTLVSRTGYTGEDGFEVGMEWDDAPAVWAALLEAGAAEGLVPAGLGARDTLRLEAGFMLYGNDIDETTTPLEAPLRWTVKWEKGDFIGREALLRQREAGVERKLVGLTVEGRAIARRDHTVRHEGRPVGRVTSGSFSPTLRASIGLGYVPPSLAAEGAGLEVGIRGRRVPARVTRLPFYRRTAA